MSDERLLRVVLVTFLFCNIAISRAKKDETDVVAIMDSLSRLRINPFSEGYTSLVSLTSGFVAEDKVLTDMQRAQKLGEERLEDFAPRYLPTTVTANSSKRSSQPS